MSASRHDQIQEFFFWDTDGPGANPIGRYQLVSLATPAEVAAAIASGQVPGNIAFGDVCVRTPLSGGVAARPVLGVTGASGWSLGQPSADLIPVHVDGVALVQFNAAVVPAAGTILTAVATETRTSQQTPFTNNFDMLIPMDARVAVTYRLCLAGELAIVPASGGANVPYYPLGVLLDTPTAKYDILRVDMTRVPRVMYA